MNQIKAKYSLAAVAGRPDGKITHKAWIIKERGSRGNTRPWRDKIGTLTVYDSGAKIAAIPALGQKWSVVPYEQAPESGQVGTLLIYHDGRYVLTMPAIGGFFPIEWQRPEQQWTPQQQPTTGYPATAPQQNSAAPNFEPPAGDDPFQQTTHDDLPF